MNSTTPHRIVLALSTRLDDFTIIARSIQALGVDLGNCLDEIEEMAELDAALLAALGQNAAPVMSLPPPALDDASLCALRLRASELLLRRLENCPIGLMTIRVASLLPFWKAVCDELAVSVTYAIAVRNPVGSEASHRWWLAHIAASINETASEARVILDMDAMLAEPQALLRRMAHALALPFHEDAPAARAFVENLRDGRPPAGGDDPENIPSQPAATPHLVAACRLLHRLATGRLEPGAPDVDETLARHPDGLGPVLDYFLRQPLHNREFTRLQHLLAERDAGIAALRQLLADQDARLAECESPHRMALAAATEARDMALAELAALRGSNSWRVMKPLRMLGQLIRTGCIPVETPPEGDSFPPTPVAAPPAEGRFDIVCFANIAWNARFQRPQQLMSQFAKNGHRVFYIVFSRLPPSGRDYQAIQVAPGVLEIALRHDVPQNNYAHCISDANLAANADALDTLARDFRIASAVSVVHLTYWARLAERFRNIRGWKIQYDCMDEWDGFPLIGDELIEQEASLVGGADLVTVSAMVLYRKWAAHSRRCLLLRNGVDFEFFERRCVPNGLLPDLRRPIVGFYGGLAEWVDFRLLAAIADARPDWNLVLIGDVFVDDLCGLDAKANVHLPGRMPYEDMPLYLYRFDVCLIPFRLNDVTHAVDPVKFYEFMSAGKPVVSVPLKEMAVYQEYVYFAEGPADFIHQIERALTETEVATNVARVELARANDWKMRFEANRQALVELYPRLSIIVVTYDNVELTRECIDSIIRNTTYPNYEIIVVDNASSDDTCNYLRYLSRTRHNVTIELNRDNRGFAAANNQGLRLARGDYLVLLNNDTVVPGGWVEPLLRHLENPDIGLVGPVTNAIGNEAKIEVDYTGLEQMADFADRYTFLHRGKVFDISMLAMFCVAMRREVFERIGFLDENFGLGLFEDDDYSRRVQAAGLRTVCAEDAFVHHHGQASFKKLIASGEYQRLWDRNQAYFETKWGTWTPHITRAAVETAA